MRYWIAVCLLVMMLAPVRVQAQEAPTPMIAGENQLGEITRESADAWFTFTSRADDPRPITLTVRSLSADFAPVMQLYDARDQRVARLQNPASIPQLSHTFTPAADTRYTVQILGANGGHGQFVLSLADPVLVPTPPVELSTRQGVRDIVTANVPVKTYIIAADPVDALLIDISADRLTDRPVVILSDGEGNMLGVLSHRLYGGRFVIPPAPDVFYQITLIHSGADRSEGFTIQISRLENAP